MTTHRITARQFVPRPVDEVFAFFADPANLGRITPESLGFRLLTSDLSMRSGLEIEYRIQPLFGIPVTWRTRIADYDPPHGFRDLQLAGPYRRWEHHHRFEPVDGGTLVHDEIEYEMPLGPLGDVANALVVRHELRRIFGFRAAAIRSIFTAPAEPSSRTVAVVGGTGFVGSAIATELHRRGDRVIVVSHQGEGARRALPDTIELRSADATTGEGLPAALDGADAVVVALAFPNSPIQAPRLHRTFDEVDARGTEQVVAAARQAGVGRLVYLSGAGAAPDAARPWFRAKWRAEEAIRGSGADWTIIRPTWIYGPRDVSLNRFLGFARSLGFVPLTNTGRQLLAPVFIDDAAALAADSVTDPRAVGQVLELGGPQRFTLREIIATALRVAGLARPIIPGPTPLIKLAALPLSLLPSPPLTPDAVDFINQPAVVDIGGLLDRMPRRLTRLDEGLRTYLAPSAGDWSVALDGSSGQPAGRSPAAVQERSR
jgi:uncharacterized protein YbjT (DUF2867 family)/ligand-binding SRPBCC domain-containing protein